MFKISVLRSEKRQGGSLSWLLFNTVLASKSSKSNTNNKVWKGSYKTSFFADDNYVEYLVVSTDKLLELVIFASFLTKEQQKQFYFYVPAAKD